MSSITFETLPTTEYYFESHITIDPVEDIVELTELASKYNFKPAKLLMDKGIPSKLDTFITGRSKDYLVLLTNTENLVNKLKLNNYVVRRYKLENILLDVRC